MTRWVYFIGFLFFIFLFSLSIFAMHSVNIASQQKIVSPRALTPAPTVEPPFTTYTAPTLSQKKEYKVVMVGDSMTHALGPHGGKFNEYINEKYKPLDKWINIENYAAGSTNIFSIKKSMTNEAKYFEWTFKPLLSRDFDLIMIESFGYNPLSQFSLDVGLQWHRKTLDKTMKTIAKTHPNARVVFVATIAPNKNKFALPVDPSTNLEQRTAVVAERVAYIKNHIAYAQEHNIPVINIYDKSLNESGDGKLEYINPDDYIHPSAVGVEFIGHELADYIYNNQVIPH